MDSKINAGEGESPLDRAFAELYAGGAEVDECEIARRAVAAMTPLQRVALRRGSLRIELVPSGGEGDARKRAARERDEARRLGAELEIARRAAAARTPGPAVIVEKAIDGESPRAPGAGGAGVRGGSPGLPAGARAFAPPERDLVRAALAALDEDEREGRDKDVRLVLSDGREITFATAAAVFAGERPEMDEAHGPDDREVFALRLGGAVAREIDAAAARIARVAISRGGEPLFAADGVAWAEVEPSASALLIGVGAWPRPGDRVHYASLALSPREFGEAARAWKPMGVEVTKGEAPSADTPWPAAGAFRECAPLDFGTTPRVLAREAGVFLLAWAPAGEDVLPIARVLERARDDEMASFQARAITLDGEAAVDAGGAPRGSWSAWVGAGVSVAVRGLAPGSSELAAWFAPAPSAAIARAAAGAVVDVEGPVVFVDVEGRPVVFGPPASDGPGNGPGPAHGVAAVVARYPTPAGAGESYFVALVGEGVGFDGIGRVLVPTRPGIIAIAWAPPATDHDAVAAEEIASAIARDAREMAAEGWGFYSVGARAASGEAMLEPAFCPAVDVGSEMRGASILRTDGLAPLRLEGLAPGTRVVALHWPPPARICIVCRGAIGASDATIGGDFDGARLEAHMGCELGFGEALAARGREAGEEAGRAIGRRVRADFADFTGIAAEPDRIDANGVELSREAIEGAMDRFPAGARAAWRGGEEDATAALLDAAAAAGFKAEVDHDAPAGIWRAKIAAPGRLRSTRCGAALVTTAAARSRAGAVALAAGLMMRELCAADDGRSGRDRDIARGLAARPHDASCRVAADAQRAGPIAAALARLGEGEDREIRCSVDGPEGVGAFRAARASVIEGEGGRMVLALDVHRPRGLRGLARPGAMIECVDGGAKTRGAIAWSDLDVAANALIIGLGEGWLPEPAGEAGACARCAGEALLRPEGEEAPMRGEVDAAAACDHAWRTHGQEVDRCSRCGAERPAV